MLIAWWRFNHPWKSSLSDGEYKMTRMDWNTVSSIIPLDPDKWRYISTYYFTSTPGGDRDYHLVYNPTKNWRRYKMYDSPSTFRQSKEMVIIQLSFSDYLKFRKYQKNKEKLAKQEKEREDLKKDNETKMMILENAQKDINKMREQAAKEVEKSAEYLRAAATSPHKPCLVEVSQGHLEDVYELYRQRHEAAILNHTSPDYFTRWQIEQERLKTMASQSEIERLSNACVSLSQSAGASYMEVLASY